MRILGYLLILLGIGSLVGGYKMLYYHLWYHHMVVLAGADTKEWRFADLAVIIAVACPGIFIGFGIPMAGGAFGG